MRIKFKLGDDDERQRESHLTSVNLFNGLCSTSNECLTEEKNTNLLSNLNGDMALDSICKSDGINIELEGKATGVFPTTSESPDVRRSKQSKYQKN